MRASGGACLLPVVLALAGAAGAAPRGRVRPRPATSGALCRPGRHTLAYHGGDLVAAPRVFVIFWGAPWQSDPVHLAAAADLRALFQQLGASAYGCTWREYALPGAPLGPGGFLGDEVIATSPVPPGGQLDDAAIRQQILAEIAAGRAPAATDDVVYVVAPPAGVPVVAGGATGCGGTNFTFCGYHDSFRSAGQRVRYAVLPFPCTQDGGTCFIAGGGDAGAALEVIGSHELSEIVTDPDAPPVAAGGWPEDRTGAETADVCEGVPRPGWLRLRVAPRPRPGARPRGPAECHRVVRRRTALLRLRRRRGRPVHLPRGRLPQQRRSPSRRRRGAGGGRHPRGTARAPRDRRGPGERGGAAGGARRHRRGLRRNDRGGDGALRPRGGDARCVQRLPRPGRPGAGHGRGAAHGHERLRAQGRDGGRHGERAAEARLPADVPVRLSGARRARAGTRGLGARCARPRSPSGRQPRTRPRWSTRRSPRARPARPSRARAARARAAPAASARGASPWRRRRARPTRSCTPPRRPRSRCRRRRPSPPRPCPSARGSCSPPARCPCSRRRSPPRP